ncbi:MAG TPA: ABC transporter ATP-binding protein [Anaerolineales bacterium]
MMLHVENLSTSYGVIRALKGISFDVHQGEIVTLIGGNGAGKSTTLMTVLGILKPNSGKVVFKGQEIQGKPAESLVRMGLALVPEGRQVFGKLTVYENLRMGAYTLKDGKEFKPLLEEVFELFPRLKERTTQWAGTLSGGEQQMLAVGRAMMQKPTFLALDEPSMGLAPIVIEDIFRTIAAIRQLSARSTVLLVEQNFIVARQLAEYYVIIEEGRSARQGKMADLAGDPATIQRYLGAA